MEILIKNMVCRHCVAAVTRILEQLGIPYTTVEIGRVELPAMPSDAVLDAFSDALAREGFERILDPADALVERIKHTVRHHVRTEDQCRLNLSGCLEKRLHQSYDTLSRAFSQHEGRTIEKYHIALKIDLVKELLADASMTLAEIADRVGYSSAAHLSRQFKNVTGMTPTEYVRRGDFARSSVK
ncbi:MAG: AraC family transcriptional regulator [Muribaculaceae bacterium]|nr:helix-turn-helix domain-containing protein [Bacteroidales bacterium]MDE6437499.1 AraC family transcriptional regulator [Muribaculaceae bacterium]